MSVTELIRLLESKLASLNNAHSTAVTIGDIQSIILLAEEIFETEQTIAVIKASVV